MKNSFTVEVDLKDVPNNIYEWESMQIISGIKVVRVPGKMLEDLLTYQGYIKSDKSILLLSDTKTACVFKLDKNGKITKRSFLTFERDEEVCEYACNLKTEFIEYGITNKKLVYSNTLKEEESVKKYLVNKISESNDEDKNKYLYYLYFDKVEGYSKDKLLKSIKKDKSGDYQVLYDFLKAH